MWHFDGSSWAVVPFDVSLAFETIWGSCPGNFWAISNDGAVWHYDGTSWTVVSVPLHTAAPPPGTLTGAGPDDVFVTGRVLPAGSQTSVPSVAHWHPGLASCGNKVLDPGEQCDPPNNTTCSDSCQPL